MYPPMVDLTLALERQKSLRGEPIRELPVPRYGHRPGVGQVLHTAAIWLQTQLENWGQVPCALMDPACDAQLT